MKLCNANGLLTDSKAFYFTFSDFENGYAPKVYELVIVEKLDENTLEPFYFSLMASMRIYRIPIPENYTLNFFVTEVQQLIEANQTSLDKVAIKWLIALNHGISEYFMSLQKRSDNYKNFKTIGELDLFKDGFLGADYISGVPSENQAAFHLAKGYMNDHKLNDVLLINHKKEIVQTSNGYLFVRFGDVIKTPSESTGVTRLTLRGQFIQQLKDRGVSVEEVALTPFELQRADECFIYNPIEGILSVSNYRKKAYATSFCESLN